MSGPFLASLRVSERPGTCCTYVGSAEAGLKPLFLLSLSLSPIGRSMLQRKSFPTAPLLQFSFCSVLWEMI